MIQEGASKHSVATGSCWRGSLIVRHEFRQDWQNKLTSCMSVREDKVGAKLLLRAISAALMNVIPMYPEWVGIGSWIYSPWVLPMCSVRHSSMWLGPYSRGVLPVSVVFSAATAANCSECIMSDIAGAVTAHTLQPQLPACVSLQQWQLVVLQRSWCTEVVCTALTLLTFYITKILWILENSGNSQNSNLSNFLSILEY